MLALPPVITGLFGEREAGAEPDGESKGKQKGKAQTHDNFPWPQDE